jgi:glyoxylase-like metal-dependent hydrolase (beta-lactamase superfamily II)
LKKEGEGRAANFRRTSFFFDEQRKNTTKGLCREVGPPCLKSAALFFVSSTLAPLAKPFNAFIMKLTIAFFLLFYFATDLHSQQANALLQNAMKGSGDWSGVRTITYRTTGKNYNKWQNYNFQNPLPMNDEAVRSFDFGAPAYYTKTISRYGGGYVFEFVNVGKDTTRYVYDVLKNRNGYQLQKGGKRVFDAGLLFVNETFPFFALRSVLQSGDTLRPQNDSTVRRLLKDGSYEDLVFDGVGRLSRINRVQKGVVTEKHFGDYTSSAGLTYPKHVSQYSNGELTRVDGIVSLTVNGVFDGKLLEIPAEYKLATAPAPMKATEIAKDVFVVENVTGGRNVLFINLSDGVLVTEAPVSKEASQGIINLVHQTLPGKRLRYVHLSHFHNDHTTGINAFLAEGATVIATPATLAAVKSIVNEDVALSAQYLPFTREHVLKDAAHEVRFYEVQNGHAEGMSFLYLPQEQVVYQGDLYSLPDDKTVTPAIEITMDFHRFIKERKLAVKRIIGHHGASAISLEQLEQAVKMRTAKE